MKKPKYLKTDGDNYATAIVKKQGDHDGFQGLNPNLSLIFKFYIMSIN